MFSMRPSLSLLERVMKLGGTASFTQQWTTGTRFALLDKPAVAPVFLFQNTFIAKKLPH